MFGFKKSSILALLVALLLLTGCTQEDIPVTKVPRKVELTPEQLQEQADREAKAAARQAADAKRREMQERRRQAELDRPRLFSSHWAKYFVAYRKLTANGKKLPPASKGGYLRGKAVVIDSATESEGLRYLLPAEVEAKTPQEVGTLVFVNVGSRKVGSYTSFGAYSGDARQQVWTVLVYDWIAQQHLATQVFYGSQPPKSFKGTSGGATGNAPTEQIEAFLKKLPRSK